MKRYLFAAAATISLIVSVYFFAFYGRGSYPFYGDAMGYYLYLPTTFIYHTNKALDWLPPDKHLDHSIHNYINSIKKTEPQTPKGYLINKYTYGVAAMELPFFLVAHAYEKILGKEANGYSFVYRTMLKTSSIVYAILGLFVLYKVLRSFFSSSLSLWGVLIIFMGTNVFWFTLLQAGMAHIPLFFLFALLIYLTILLHKEPRKWLFAAAGMVAGLIVVSRPADIVCLLIPLFYNVYNKASLREKTIFLKENITGIVLFGFAFMLPCIPQLLYWKKFAGNFIYYSYGQERFDWLHPKVLQGLFSFQNGWLIYTPVMTFSLAGLLLYKKFRPVSTVLFAVVPLYIFIIYCWYCWYYINGLGSRPMIDIYPLLAIPLVAFLRYLSECKVYIRVIATCFFLFFVSLNVCYSIQQAKGLLISEESNAVYNMHMLFKLKADYADLVTYDIKQVQPHEDMLKKMATLGCENYDTAMDEHYVRDSTKSGYFYHMSDREEYQPRKLIDTYTKKLFGDAEWIKCSGRFMCPKPYLYYKHLLNLDFLKGDQSYAWYGCKIDNKIGLTEPDADPGNFNLGHSWPGHWSTVYFFVKIPPQIAEGDKLRLEVWNIGMQEIYFDDICMELYRSK